MAPQNWTHLVVPQPHQDDVWRVDPDLQGNKNSSLSRRDLCDLHSQSGRSQARLWTEPGQVKEPLYLFPELSSDVAEPLGSVEAHGLQPPVPQHLDHLSVFWNTPGGQLSKLTNQPTQEVKPDQVWPGLRRPPGPGLTLPVLLEHQLSLLGLVLVLSTPPVFTSFTCEDKQQSSDPDGSDLLVLKRPGSKRKPNKTFQNKTLNFLLQLFKIKLPPDL